LLSEDNCECFGIVFPGHFELSRFGMRAGTDPSQPLRHSHVLHKVLDELFRGKGGDSGEGSSTGSNRSPPAYAKCPLLLLDLEP